MPSAIFIGVILRSVSIYPESGSSEAEREQQRVMAEIIASQVIQDFAIIMVIASVIALVSYKLKQPMVIGYIAAGMIIGPHTPPFSLILHPEILILLAEIGIVLLLFVVGLEYPIAKLRAVGKKALTIAFAEAFGTFGLGIKHK